MKEGLQKEGLQAGVIRLSDKLYNQGLEKLQNSDFHNGIELLTKSINVNKKNVEARNLLGLAQFELGRVGDAVEHWKISESIQAEDNRASKYLSTIQKNTRNKEKLNNAVTMYNNALEQLKNKSDDLAIIQLKKAIETNPNFLDAINLLTLCYLIQKDTTRATQMAERALAIDMFNPIALGYYSLLHPGRNRFSRVVSSSSTKKEATTTEKEGATVGYRTVGNLREKKQRNFHLAEILFFIVGVACSAAVIFFLVQPAIQRENDRERTAIQNQLESTIREHYENTTLIMELVDEARKDAIEAQVRVTQLQEEIDLQDRIIRVGQAHELYSNNLMLDAVNLLETIDMTGLPFDVRARIEAIETSAYPRIAQHYGGLANTAFNANDMHMALVNREIVQRFIVPGAPNWSTHLYQLGTLYYNGGRLYEARELLETLRDNFPNYRPLNTGRMLTSIASQT